MANTTARGAVTIHGTNPQFLIERVVRARIYDSTYWKEQCFGLTAASLVDRAADLQYVGGTYGMLRPSAFLCLVCKLLQLQPEREIVLEYLRATELKYLQALAAMYIRMTFRSFEIYELLEPLLDDYRKLRWRDMGGAFSISHMDEFVDALLTEERVCDLILPRLQRRDVVEETEGLRPRVSRLEDALVLGDANGEHAGDQDDAYDSDDSLRALRRERAARVERADRTRTARLEKQARARAYGVPLAEEEDGEQDYQSQESESEEERLRARYMRSASVSPDREVRSRSASVSPDRALRSRSPSISPDRALRSRSPSISPDRALRSRSPSISPDRALPPRPLSRSPSVSPGGSPYQSRSPSRTP